MKRSKALWGLVALNGVLACAMAWKFTPENRAVAQPVAARGEYLMVPARVTGANNGVVYIIDTRNEALGGFAYNDNRKTLDPLTPIDLRRIFDAGAGLRR